MKDPKSGREPLPVTFISFVASISTVAFASNGAHIAPIRITVTMPAYAQELGADRLPSANEKAAANQLRQILASQVNGDVKLRVLKDEQKKPTEITLSPGYRSYAGFWVTRRSGGVVFRHLDDLDAVFESDTCADLRQLI
ncbi:hypothetical protein ACVI1J_005460 [Bradyrhizobium diazoefficiens]